MLVPFLIINNKQIMIYPETFNNERRYIFSNWSNEDFTGLWEGKEHKIKAGEVKEFPMYLAFHLCKHFVDREMNKSGKSNFMGDDGARKEYEEKTITEITGSTESPALAALKAQIKEELKEAEGKVTKKKEEKAEKKAEFEDLKK